MLNSRQDARSNDDAEVSRRATEDGEGSRVLEVLESLRRTRIIAIGASAGGLEALERTFANVPPDLGVAYVVLQHLSPDHVSHLGELLSRKTNLPVSTATDDEIPQANHIYLIPHDADLEIVNARFALKPRDDERKKLRSIDLFMESLAVDRGYHSVGIVLSGTGSDATDGLRAIHSVDGLVMAQDPRSATFDGMPTSAIASNCVDIVLPPEAIGECLAAYVASELPASEFAARNNMGESQIDVLKELSERAKPIVGVQLSHFRSRKIFEAAVGVLAPAHFEFLPDDDGNSDEVVRRSKSKAIKQLRDYAPVAEAIRTELLDDPRGIAELFRTLLCDAQQPSDTTEYWTFLSRRVVPMLVRAGQSQGRVRCWIPFSCDALEPGVWAAMLDAEVVRQGLDIEIEVVANQLALQTAEDAPTWGQFENSRCGALPREILEAGFTVTDGVYSLRETCKKHVQRKAIDLLSFDAPSEKFHVVCMRGLLTLLTADSHDSAIEHASQVLAENGLICLGAGETIRSSSRHFVKLDDRFRVFRMAHWSSLSKGSRPTSRWVDQTGNSEHGSHITAPWAGSPAAGGPANSTLMKAYDKALLFMESPGFVIDEKFELAHSFGGASGWLTMPGGTYSRNLLQLCPEPLASMLPGVVSRALHFGEEVELSDVRLPLPNDGTQPDAGPEQDEALDIERGEGDDVNVGFYRLRVTLLTNRGKPRYLLVVLQSEKPVNAQASPLAEQDHGITRTRAAEKIERLERELAQTKRHLRATVQALETSNEELQATNEELTASNEEMQSSNEELQSVNEEVVAVNEEMQSKVVQLREANDDMSNLLRSTDIAVIYLDELLNLRRFTQEATKYFAIMPQDAGRPLEHFRNILEYEELVDDCVRVAEKHEPTIRNLTDARGAHLLLRILPYRQLDDVRGVVITIVDISRVKVAEAIAAKMQAIVENSTDAIMGISNDGRIETWNSGARDMYGWSSDEAIGTNIEELFGTSEPACSTNLRDLIASSSISESLKMMHRRADGREFPVWLVVSNFETEDGESGLAVSVRDISEQTQAEKSVREAVVRRDQFLAMLSHELRNPLGAIASATQLLKRPEANLEACVEVMDRQLQHVVRLLDDLLDVSRMTRGKLNLQLEEVDLTQICRDSIDAMRPRIKERQHQIDVQLPDEPVIVDGDRDRLLQVVDNLMSNAVKYTPEGGEIQVQLGKIVGIDARDVAGEMAEILVTDNGVGLEIGQGKDIFELFAQRKNSVTDSTDGLGVGLALVKGIVENHGGRIEVTSDGLGRGAQFRVLLPIGKVSVPLNRVLESADEPSFIEEPLQIAIVEDGDDNRRLLAQLLTLDGHRVEGFATGKAGLSAILQQQPQVALIDIGLPDISGLEIAERVRQQFNSGEVYLIAVTGLGRESDHSAIFNAGFDEHIVKPIALDALNEAINRRKRSS